MDFCFPSGFLGSLFKWPLPLSYSVLVSTKSPSVWYCIWKWENLGLSAAGKLCVHFCGDNCVFESWIGDIILDMVQPHSDMGEHRTLGGVFWNLLISVACHSNGP